MFKKLFLLLLILSSSISFAADCPMDPHTSFDYYDSDRASYLLEDIDEFLESLRTIDKDTFVSNRDDLGHETVISILDEIETLENKFRSARSILGEIIITTPCNNTPDNLQLWIDYLKVITRYNRYIGDLYHFGLLPSSPCFDCEFGVIHTSSVIEVIEERIKGLP